VAVVPDANRVDLDHLVYAVRDLAAGAAHIAALAGVDPVLGGRHVGRGTANHLLGLGGGAYLEIIGPDPDAPDPDGPRPFGIDDLAGDGLVTWCVRPADLDACVARARAAGHDPGEPAAMSRRTPAGALLEWRLTPTRPDGVVPFLIDWGRSTHPTASGLPAIELVSLTAAVPDPAATREALDALGITGATIAVEAGEPTRPRLRAVVSGRLGRFEITGP
jgi:hypothetical protein